MIVSLTLWRSLYGIDDPVTEVLDWKELVALCTKHKVHATKDRAPGFGPYVLSAPPVTCYKHQDGKPRTLPHRCDSCVQEMTLLVFDADAGTEQDKDECDAILQARGLARIWYSSYSYSSVHAAYRLIIPLTRPVPAAQWPVFRLTARRVLKVPADAKACSGRSHFYYLPSCPPGVATAAKAVDGDPLDPNEFLLAKFSPKAVSTSTDTWTAPTTAPEDLAELRERLHALAQGPLKGPRGDLLDKCLRGAPLADHGARNTSALITTGLLAWNAPGYGLDTYKSLLAGSVNAMIREGSKLTWPQVDRMILTAMRAEAQTRATAEKFYVSKLQGTFNGRHK